MTSESRVQVGEVWAYGPGRDARTVIGHAVGSTSRKRVFVVRHPERAVPTPGRGPGLRTLDTWDSVEPEWLIAAGVRVAASGDSHLPDQGEGGA